MSPILILHILGGGVGLLAGYAAISMRKGETLHRAFGKVFVVAMLVMGLMAAWLAVTIPGQMPNFYGGVFTLYLVSTAWMTVARKEGTTGLFEIAAFLLTFAFAAIVAYAIAAGRVPTQRGVPWFAIYVFLGIAVFCAAGDLHVVAARGISGAQRIARHVWRMCLGLFVASGSFFLGKQAHFPKFIQGSPILVFLAFLPLLLMLFWLARVFLTRQFRAVQSIA